MKGVYTEMFEEEYARFARSSTYEELFAGMDAETAASEAHEGYFSIDGGRVISPPEEIRLAYETGRGSLLLRCKWEREQLARGQWRVVITELPHGVSAKLVPAGDRRARRSEAELRQEGGHAGAEAR